MSDKVYGYISLATLVALLVSIGATIHFYYQDDALMVMVFVAIIVILIVGWIIMTVKVVKHDEQKAKEKLDAIPITTEPATVTSKISEQHVEGVTTTSTRHTYYIVFEFADKRREKFTVDKRQYALVNEGDKGILQYKHMPDAQLANNVLFIDFKLQG